MTLLMNRIQQDFRPKTKAFEHQIEAINYIINNTQVALFDEQGLGKTKIVIDALCIAMEKAVIEGVLVVAPMSLIYNWEMEIKKHSYLIPIVLRGTKREKRYKFLTGANFYITNYEAVVAELERIRRFCKSRKVAIVLDESARIKAHETKTAQALFAFRHYSVKRIIITGTPVANKPVDLWSQYYFLDGGNLLGDNFGLFKSKFNEKRVDYQQQLIKLRETITENSIRRCKDDVLELPEKRFVNIYVELKGKQLKLYEELRDKLRIEIQGMNGETIVDEADNILKKLLRLTQIASNPWLVDKGYKETPIKFHKLTKILEEVTSKDEKTIIWSSFIENILLLKNLLKGFNPLVIYGDVPVKERAEFVERFQGSSKNKIMIANPSAAREGLTLTRANNAIYLDRTFNLVDYLQSQDRIHRISQTNKCSIYKLLARNTIDEYVDRVIEFKSDVAGFVQGDTGAIRRESLNFLKNKKGLLEMLGC
jgi:SNF2 family DNA or RNA helicase